jgi:hypothetical protein
MLPPRARRQASGRVVHIGVERFRDEAESGQRARETENAAAEPCVAGRYRAQPRELIEGDVLERRALDKQEDLAQREVQGLSRRRHVAPVHDRLHDPVERLFDPRASKDSVRQYSNMESNTSLVAVRLIASYDVGHGALAASLQPPNIQLATEAA